MKKRVWFILLALLLVSAFILSACGAADSEYYAKDEADYSDYDVEYEETALLSANGVVTPANRKVIYTVDMSVTVASLTDAMQKLSNRVNEMGGWTETSREREGYANLTFRVPVAQLNSFMNEVADMGEVENKSVNTEDITSQYADTERKIDLYQKEYDAYAALYETLCAEEATAENTQNKLEVLKAMQEASAMIDEYNGKLSSYDKLVDFCTFDIYLYEEDVYEEESYWTELGNVFSGSIGSMGSVFGFILKAVVAVIPYAAIIAAVLGIIFGIIKVTSKKKVPAKKAENAAPTAENPQ